MIFFAFRPYRWLLHFIGCNRTTACTLLLAESGERKGMAEGATGSESYWHWLSECFILCAVRVWHFVIRILMQWLVGIFIFNIYRNNIISNPLYVNATSPSFSASCNTNLDRKTDPNFLQKNLGQFLVFGKGNKGTIVKKLIWQE